MKVIGKRILFEFSKSHATVASQVSAWLAEAEEAEWSTPNDVKARYVHASFLSDNRVVFNIKGNKYRIDTKINYQHQIVLVKRIGTHSEYNKWRF
jgi:Uncharacterized protein conserved in bacteria